MEAMLYNSRREITQKHILLTVLLFDSTNARWPNNSQAFFPSPDKSKGGREDTAQNECQHSKQIEEVYLSV